MNEYIISQLASKCGIKVHTCFGILEWYIWGMQYRFFKINFEQVNPSTTAVDIAIYPCFVGGFICLKEIK